MENPANMQNPGINVTQPFLPPLEEFYPYLEEIWKSRVLTNNGPLHQQLERELCRYLNVEHVSLFANATLALITALQALRITGEVITTPFSFVATTHALWWNNIKPVFVDIEPETFTLDPDKIEAAITPQTTALLPVHVYGYPCKINQIEDIAKRYGLKVIYDAAHTLCARLNGQSLCNFGDLAVLSFHATKVFNTFEGGAIVCHSREMKEHIDNLKNFGFRGETTVVAPGINAKMNEIQAAIGLLQLKYIDQLIAERKEISELYRKYLRDIPGIYFMENLYDIRQCYSYFPMFVVSEEYGKSRDALYEKLKDNLIFARRYFYPLISQFPSYRALESALPGKMPVAERISDQVICLPLFPGLKQDSIEKVRDIIIT